LTDLRCVVFDIDDTLYLERDYVRSGFAAVSRYLEQEKGMTGFLQLAWGQFLDGRRGDTFNYALRHLGAPEEWVSELVSIYRHHSPGITLLPDAEALLTALTGRVHLAVISDGPLASQSKKVAALCLSRWFSLIVLTDVYGQQFCKPHPRAFEEVQLKYAVTGKQCMYIADNPAKDFAAPVRLGWRTLRVRRDGGLHQAAASTPGVPEAKDLGCWGDVLPALVGC
jgi:putative hydrolase of the HAD superfamily